MDNYKIAWNQSLEIGDRAVDSQHQHLIELIAAVPEYDSALAQKALQEAMDYAASHFAAEEALMERINYPLSAVHKRAHKKLTRVLVSYKKQFDEGNKDLYAFRQFMYRWIKDHIMDEDQVLGGYIRGQE